MTWITPLLVATSAFVTRESLIRTVPPTLMRTLSPSTVRAGRLQAHHVRAVTRPGTTW